MQKLGHNCIVVAYIVVAYIVVAHETAKITVGEFSGTSSGRGVDRAALVRTVSTTSFPTVTF